MNKKPSERSNAILSAARSAVADASSVAEAKISASTQLPASPLPPPAVLPPPARIRFSGYFSDAEVTALSQIRIAYSGERLPDNLLVRAAVRAAQPELLRVHLDAILAEDRRRVVKQQNNV